MPKTFSRTLRIAEQIRRELADLIRLEVKDPRVGMVTLTDVEVTPDYAHAKVFFTVFGDPAQVEASATGLNRASGYLRHALGRLIRLRITPELHFIYDSSVENGMRLSQLIDEAVASDAAPVPSARKKPAASTPKAPARKKAAARKTPAKKATGKKAPAKKAAAKK